MEGAGRHKVACLLFAIAVRNPKGKSVCAYIIR